MDNFVNGKDLTKEELEIQRIELEIEKKELELRKIELILQKSGQVGIDKNLKLEEIKVLRREDEFKKRRGEEKTIKRKDGKYKIDLEKNYEVAEEMAINFENEDNVVKVTNDTIDVKRQFTKEEIGELEGEAFFKFVEVFVLPIMISAVILMIGLSN